MEITRGQLPLALCSHTYVYIHIWDLTFSLVFGGIYLTKFVSLICETYWKYFPMKYEHKIVQMEQK